MAALLDRVPRLSPRSYQRICQLTIVALAVLVVTGAGVRLTGSGLGCSDWPTCEEHQFVAAMDQPQAVVEFANRVFTALVSIGIALAVLGSLVRSPRRRDLVWLSVGLIGGLVAEGVLGGIQVRLGLAPQFVIAHFALAMILLWNAVVLEQRSGEGPTERTPIVGPPIRNLGRSLCALATLVLFTGTLVTGSGPHGGDQRVERLPFFIPDVARVHSLMMWCLLGTTIVTLWLLKRDGAPQSVDRRGQLLVGAIVVQGAIGYIQYFTGVPPFVVLLHIIGATVVWIAVLRFHLGLWARAEIVEPATPTAVTA